MSEPTNQRCCKRFIPSGRGAPGGMRMDRRCSRDAIVCRDGKWYCWQHDPVARDRRREEMLRRIDRERRWRRLEEDAT